MLDNRNTILAVVLSGLVLIGWQYFFNIPQMERQRAQQQIQSQLANPAATPGAVPGNSPPAATNVPAAPGTVPANQQPAAATVVSRDAAIASAPRIKIETPRVTGSISLKGARIDDVALNQFRETVDPKSPAIVLFSPSGTAAPYYAEFGWVAAAGSNVKIPDSNTQWT